MKPRRVGDRGEGRYLALVLAALAAGCQTRAPRLDLDRAGADVAEVERVSQETVVGEVRPDPRDHEQVIPTGLMLRSPEDRAWGAHMVFPTTVGWTDFTIDDISLENLVSLTVIPTGEFIVPIDETWTMLPYAGLGGAVQLGDKDQVGEDRFIGVARGGLRTQAWHPLSERYRFVFTTDLRYSLALVERDGVIGDWGTLVGAVELRRNFGDSSEATRFQGGLYTQGFWYWDPIKIEIDGVTPTFIDGQVELGVSLGSTKPYKVLGISVPRIFLGARFGGEIEEFRIRFGRL